MSELQNVQSMLATAESVATAGNLAHADELLRAVARIQEAELGPFHPDLANTLNNLAIVAERTERLAEANTLYRRAVAIASASLPSDDPLVAAGRQNLEDFCRAHGFLIDGPDVIAAATPATELQPAASARHDAAAAESTTQADIENADIGAGATPALVATRAPDVVVPAPDIATSSPSPDLPSDARAVPSLAKAAIVVLVLVAVAFFGMRPRPSRGTSSPPPAVPAAAMETGQPSEEQRSERGSRNNPTDKPAASGRATAVGITMTAAELCRTFSASGASWRCDPAGAVVAPGPMVLYTRVKTPRDGAVIHRWYRGDTLRKSVRLEVRANATQGYRTYSRQVVDAAADWRVEVRSSTGDILHEQRFAVR